MPRVIVVLVLALAVLTSNAAATRSVSGGALRSYVRAVEPIRLGVNDLLESADPILNAYRAHQTTGDQAGAAMDALERRFAGYTVAINALVPSDPSLARLHAPYAHTYILEDAYLSALAAALPAGDFSALPNTQSEQRATIIEWRTQLDVISRRTHTPLPSDLQQAGRGEIAPAISGS
ncbi:MAG TPA: hypothetical protein VLV81_11235 [Acidimicrobiia bacterium]|nr:hypothetical protein [Acidimicrobiia bacterium]